MRKKNPPIGKEWQQELENFSRPLDLPKDEETMTKWIQEAQGMVDSESRVMDIVICVANSDRNLPEFGHGDHSASAFSKASRASE